MTEFFNNLFVNLFNGNVILATILIAMIPIIELRGAIPFATNVDFWGKYTLNNWSAFGWSLLGSSAVVPILALLFIPIIKWLKSTKLFGKLATAVENRIKSRANNIDDTNEKNKTFSKQYWKKVVGVFIFVAIPLPFTGVWTGTCIAVFLGLDYLTTCLSVVFGNMVAGILIALILEFFPWLNNWLFYIFLALILLVLLYEIIRYLIKKSKEKKSERSE